MGYILKEKYEAFENFKIFKAKVETKTGFKIKCLRSNHSGEFISSEFNNFCDKHGIRRQFSALKTPQQNRVVERKNRSILDVSRKMMMEANLPHIYWREAVRTMVYTFNKVHIKGETGKTPYELWFGNTPIVKYFKIFGSKCYIKRDDNIGKFNPRSDEGIFLGYSNEIKAYRCYNKRLQKIVESSNVKVDELRKSQIRIYEKEPIVEMIIFELVEPLSE